MEWIVWLCTYTQCHLSLVVSLGTCESGCYTYVCRCGLYMRVELYTIDPLGLSNLADMEKWPIYTRWIVCYRLFGDLVTWLLLRVGLPIQWLLYTGFTAHVVDVIGERRDQPTLLDEIERYWAFPWEAWMATIVHCTPHKGVYFLCTNCYMTPGFSLGYHCCVCQTILSNTIPPYLPVNIYNIYIRTYEQ